MAKILVVEDDATLQDNLRDWLTFEHHIVETASNGGDGLELLRFYKYDLVILDWQLPNMDGIEVCRQFRSLGGSTPVLMLTGKDSIADKEAGLDAGADDYLTKPFHTKELSARVRALLRRPSLFTATLLQVGLLELDPTAHTVRLGGAAIKLIPKEFALLEFLMRHPDQVFSAEILLDHIWESESNASIDTLRTYMKTLRRKITPDGGECPITTVHGLGYKLEAQG